ncbi:EcsC family protein [Propionibacteriaceae bacterium Y2011]|uniref:EcsC family protein n=1 Tax=Microlunatus sp. Y2014 TaxID=3418488 RepID=UPI003B4C92A1
MSDKPMGKVMERLQQAAPVAGGVLRRMLETAIDGVGPLPSAKHSAISHLQRTGDVDHAIDSLITTHIAMAGAQGFVTNLGGFAAMPITIPANTAGILTIQTRMIAAIAHLRGYHLADNRVRTAIVMCLLGGEEIARRIHQGTLPTSPMAVATAPVFDPELDQAVAREVLKTMASRVGGKGLSITVSKRIPLIGGGVGAVVDGWATRQLGSFTKDELRTRRVR